MFVQRIKVFPFVIDVEVRYLHYLITTTITASCLIYQAITEDEMQQQLLVSNISHSKLARKHRILNN